MKSKLTLASMMLLALFTTGCTAQSEMAPVDLLNDEFPESKQEIMETIGTIAQSLKDGDMDKLISLHAYSPKFTEFNKGEHRVGSAGNETYEREVFGALTEVVKFDSNDLQIAVYGDVANVTFHSDFHLKFGEDLVVVNDQISLLFLKTSDGWKIVAEHHSPLKKEES